MPGHDAVSVAFGGSTPYTLFFSPFNFSSVCPCRVPPVLLRTVIFPTHEKCQCAFVTLKYAVTMGVAYPLHETLQETSPLISH